jgi:hypothetical protein
MEFSFFFKCVSSEVRVKCNYERLRYYFIKTIDKVVILGTEQTEKCQNRNKLRFNIYNDGE